MLPLAQVAQGVQLLASPDEAFPQNATATREKDKFLFTLRRSF
jgi:hypothetical protein